MFRLDPRLAEDTEFVAALALCSVLLMRHARFPWLVLVPARAGFTGLHDLDAADRARLMEEIVAASLALRAMFAPDKINVGALGNIVSQLHVHIVARRRGDAAWPGPVWGHDAPEAYAADALAATRDRLAAALTGG